MGVTKIWKAGEIVGVADASIKEWNVGNEGLASELINDSTK